MIHFSHGNGFPAETYHQMIKGLRQQVNLPVSYISCLGHNPDYLVIDDWSVLVEEVINFVGNSYKEPVIALGHSLGGVISYWACMQRPDLFKAVILLDSPIYSNFKNIFINIIKALGLLDYFTPAKNTKNRRYTWPSYQAALDHFSSKRVFRYFDKLCLKDYVYFGTEKNCINNSNEINLKFDPIIEWKIYNSIPSTNFSKLPNEIPCGLIYGQYSKVVSDKDAIYMANKYGVQIQKLPNCGHLFPFECPVAAVEAIAHFISTNNL